MKQEEFFCQCSVVHPIINNKHHVHERRGLFEINILIMNHFGVKLMAAFKKRKEKLENILVLHNSVLGV